MQRQVGFIPQSIRHFITVSEFSLGILRPYLPTQASFHAVPNVIDIPKQPPVPVGENSAYTMVGRLSPEKGPTCFAEAATQGPYDAVFVGDGECRRLIHERFPAVRITGWCSREQVVRHLRRARALVFPSLWYEAQPLAVLEAAAMGIPSIVSDRCAARDDVVNGVTGLWFQGGNAADLAEKLRQMQDNRTVQAMGLAAYNRYWAHPQTIEDHVTRLEAVYAAIFRSIHA
jgi:glycosyltransferase involved in cell wall biosynthesis